jgi:hypothetical protein
MATKKIKLPKKIYSVYVYELYIKKWKTKISISLLQNWTILQTEFYTFFGTIEEYWKKIYKLFQATSTKDYPQYDMKSKLLSFTFFWITYS